MEHLTTGQENALTLGIPENTVSEKETRKNKLKYNSITAWILVFSFSISLISLVIYLAEVGFSDINLYILLIVLRYSSFMVCICSFHKMVMHVYGLFRRYKFRPRKFFMFLGFFMYGFIIILFEAFIIAISRGNE